jgi:hypothetical protein
MPTIDSIARPSFGEILDLLSINSLTIKEHEDNLIWPTLKLALE